MHDLYQFLHGSAAGSHAEGRKRLRVLTECRVTFVIFAHMKSLSDVVVDGTNLLHEIGVLICEDFLETASLKGYCFCFEPFFTKRLNIVLCGGIQLSK